MRAQRRGAAAGRSGGVLHPHSKKSTLNQQEKCAFGLSSHTQKDAVCKVCDARLCMHVVAIVPTVAVALGRDAYLPSREG